MSRASGGFETTSHFFTAEVVYDAVVDKLNTRKAELGMTNRHLASLCGVVPPLISMWKNQDQNVPLEQLLKWAAALGFEIHMKFNLTSDKVTSFEGAVGILVARQRKLRFTSRQLAQKLRYTEQSVGSWRAGRVKPATHVVIAWATVLGGEMVLVRV